MRIIKAVLILGVLAVAGLAGYAYFADFAPAPETVTQPVPLDAR